MDWSELTNSLAARVKSYGMKPKRKKGWAAVNRKTSVMLFFGSVLLLASFILGWRAFGTTFDSILPSIVCPIAAIVSFILAVYLLKTATRGLRNVESTALLRDIGTVVLLIGATISLYAAVAFFIRNDLPPNTVNRLPSLYMLFAGMGVMFAGTAVRSFRLRN
jgi:hypothetical protein